MFIRRYVVEKVSVLLADEDEKYLAPLERKFIVGFGDRANIIVITDRNYLDSFFSAPQNLDILIINEALYGSYLKKHNIANIFIISEQAPDGTATGDLDTHNVYKYTSVNEIYNKVVSGSSSVISTRGYANDSARVILTYSPIGGIGKTTVAMALCGALAENQKRVLFIGTDNLQTFRIFPDNKTVLKTGADKLIFSGSEHSYEGIRPLIINEGFSILPPFQRVLSSIKAKSDNYIQLINSIKKSRDFDYIILDTATDFSEDTSKLMGFAENIMIITGQDRHSAHKLKCLLMNIDFSDQNRYSFICNKYREDQENLLVADEFLNVCRIKEYIKHDDRLKTMGLNEMARLESFQKIALMYF